jgi:hypothetical protein
MPQDSPQFATKSELEDLWEAFRAYQEAIQATLGPLLRDVGGPNGLKERQTRLEAAMAGLQARTESLKAMEKARQTGPTTLELANRIADLALKVARMDAADRYALTREKLGRLMLAHGLISEEEMAASLAVAARAAQTEPVAPTTERVASATEHAESVEPSDG